MVKCLTPHSHFIACENCSEKKKVLHPNTPLWQKVIFILTWELMLLLFGFMFFKEMIVKCLCMRHLCVPALKYCCTLTGCKVFPFNSCWWWKRMLMTAQSTTKMIIFSHAFSPQYRMLHTNGMHIIFTPVLILFYFFKSQ